MEFSEYLQLDRMAPFLRHPVDTCDCASVYKVGPLQVAQEVAVRMLSY